MIRPRRAYLKAKEKCVSDKSRHEKRLIERLKLSLQNLREGTASRVDSPVHAKRRRAVLYLQ